jgi:oxygen-independent coproporphyrinogen-3 oxidase
MQPDRLAIYNYAHLPERFKGQRMIHERDIPTPSTKLAILSHTIDKLDAAGYVYIGMDHFALPGDDLVRAQRDGSLQRNFQGYSTHAACDLIGLGVSAIGSIGASFAQNTPSTIEYEALIGERKLPLKRGLVVDADDQLRAKVISALMCYDHLNYFDFDRQYGIDFSDYFAPELRMLLPLEQDGLVAIDEEGIRISAKGRLLLRSIAMVFDRYLSNEENDGRFSRAI